MVLTGPLARAARALVEWPRDRVAQLSGVSVEALAAFERAHIDPGQAARDAIRAALEQGGAVFIPEADGVGAGVHLKFARKVAKQINRMENEGGPVGEDDV